MFIGSAILKKNEDKSIAIVYNGHNIGKLERVLLSDKNEFMVYCTLEPFNANEATTFFMSGETLPILIEALIDHYNNDYLPEFNHRNRIKLSRVNWEKSLAKINHHNIQANNFDERQWHDAMEQAMHNPDYAHLIDNDELTTVVILRHMLYGVLGYVANREELESQTRFVNKITMTLNHFTLNK